MKLTLYIFGTLLKVVKTNKTLSPGENVGHAQKLLKMNSIMTLSQLVEGLEFDITPAEEKLNSQLISQTCQ